MEIIKNRDAQFMLLGGFIIAIGLVITTVLMTSIIFEINMALSVGTEPVKNDIINLIQIARDEIRAAYRNATQYGGMANFNNQSLNFSKNLSKIYALNGEGVNMSVDTENWKERRFANFTDNGKPDGANNWTVIENVRNSTIKVNVTGSSPFKINVSGKNNYWLINIDSNFSASIGNVTAPYSIVFINGRAMSGNYSITGNFSTSESRNFTRGRDYILNTTIMLATSNVKTNITVPVSVPW